MHQIRVHLAAIELPVVGDAVYGVPEPALGRQFLHAARLAFPHPFTGERIETRSPLPPDLAAYPVDPRLIARRRLPSASQRPSTRREPLGGRWPGSMPASTASAAGALQPKPRKGLPCPSFP